MRKVLVVEQVNSKAARLAEKLGIVEIACNVPRFEGIVKSLPSVVVESATNPGVIVATFNAERASREELDTLEDLPETQEPVVTDPLREIQMLKPKVLLANEHEVRIKHLENLIDEIREQLGR
jgi:hypothetical protein